MQQNQEINDVIDAEIVSVTDNVAPTIVAPLEEEGQHVKNNIKTMLAALSAAVNGGEIKSSQAAEIRRRFGISKRYFTKRKYNFAKVKARRKMAALSRSANRGTGKGEKRTGGIA